MNCTRIGGPLLLWAAMLGVAACGGEQTSTPAGTGAAPPAKAAAAEAPTAASASTSTEAQAPPEEQPTQALDLADEDLKQLYRPWTGDFDQIASGKRRFIRALVPMSKTMYYIDVAEQRGIAFEALREFEKVLAETGGKSAIKPKVAIIPTSREHMFAALEQGRGDIAVAGLTVTESRKARVAFSEPTMTGVRQLIVTGPSAPPLNSLEDLAGKEVHVRRSSSYYEELTALNRRFAREGKPPIGIQAADENLEDEDLLEMVDAGIIPITVAKDFTAKLWAQLYDRLTVHNDIALATDGQLAWAVRRGAPKLLKVVNNFVSAHRAGTLFGNTMLKRYLGSAERLKNPTTEAEMRKFRGLRQYFQKYGGQYDLDWLLVAAQGYQESRLDQTVKSRVGAVGIMQVKRETAGDMGIRNIDVTENNIHAGVKYLRFMIDHYYKDAPMDRANKGLFALASYNAGPARITKLRKRAASIGLNPDVWFMNVEVAASRDIGRETVDYVSNIFKYYTAFKLVVAHRAQKAASPGD